MAGRALIKMFDPVISWMATRYQAAVADNLRRHGLRYEDLYDPLLNQVHACPIEEPRCHCAESTKHVRPLCLQGQDVEEALKRLPQEEVDARNQRLKRASDCSLKKAYLPKDLQAVQTPYKSYLGVRPAMMCSAFSAACLQPRLELHLCGAARPGACAARKRGEGALGYGEDL